MADEKLNILILAMAKKYTDKSLAGAGAVAGVPCQIQSITPITGGNRVTFLWEDNNNVSHTSTLDVMDGAGGEENKIDSISVNGSPISIDENKNVDITVPSIEGLTKDTDLATVAKSGSYEDLSNKPEIPSVEGFAKTTDIPTKVSDLENDSNYLSSIPEEYVTETELSAKGYLTEHQDISNLVEKEDGKGLSSNDYTTEEKDKLASLENYDDTQINADITSLSSRVKTVEDEVPNLATKTYVGEQIANADHLKREIVEALPSDAEASDNIIYMLKVESATGNDKYKEYMKIDGTVQMVGDTSVDLTDYAKSVDIPTTVAELTDSADYAKKTDIPETLPADGGNADTVNNHTVETNVPADAKFTDTVYDDTEVKESIEELNSNLSQLEFNDLSGGKNVFDISKIDLLGVEYRNGVYTNKITDSKTFFCACIDYWNDDGYMIRYPNESFIADDKGRYSITGKIIEGCTKIRFKHSGTTADIVFFITPISYFGLEVGDTFTISMDVDGYNPSTAGGLIVKNIQIEKGSSATPYKPYVPSVKMLAEEVNQQNENLAPKKIELQNVDERVTIKDNGSFIINGFAFVNLLVTFNETLPQWSNFVRLPRPKGGNVSVHCENSVRFTIYSQDSVHGDCETYENVSSGTEIRLLVNYEVA
jgi:hypothetical protein